MKLSEFKPLPIIGKPRIRKAQLTLGYKVYSFDWVCCIGKLTRNALRMGATDTDRIGFGYTPMTAYRNWVTRNGVACDE